MSEQGHVTTIRTHDYIKNRKIMSFQFSVQANSPARPNKWIQIKGLGFITHLFKVLQEKQLFQPMRWLYGGKLWLVFMILFNKSRATTGRSSKQVCTVKTTLCRLFIAHKQTAFVVIGQRRKHKFSRFMTVLIQFTLTYELQWRRIHGQYLRCHLFRLGK